MGRFGITMKKVSILLVFISLLFGQVDYSTQIQPIFNNNCTSCHINGGAYSGGLDLSSGTCAAAVVVGGKEQLDNTPQKDLDQAFEQLSRMLKPGNVVHNGIYSGNKPNLTVFTAVGGLARPALKLEELAKLGDL